MRPDSAIRIVVCLTLGLSAEAATITIDGQRGSPAFLTWHDDVFGYSGIYSGLTHFPGYPDWFGDEPIDDGDFYGYTGFRLPPVEDVIALRMDIYPLQRTIVCDWDCSAYGESWLTSLRLVRLGHGEQVNLPVSTSSINLLALGPEFFPSSDQETVYQLFFGGAGYLSAPHPFHPPTEPYYSFLASMRHDLPATLTATTLVVPEPRYYGIAGGLLLAGVFVSRRRRVKH
jgi:hypothetical protein